MDLIYWIIIFSLLGGVISVLAASVFLLIPEPHRSRILPHSVSFAIGALLGAAFLALLPHAITGPQRMEVHDLGLTVLLGMLSFFILEKLVIWRHCHTTHCEAHTPHEHHEAHNHKVAGSMILIGDGLHNLVDGVLIAAAFMTDIHLGIVTSLAVATHEIPQEVGDFAVLLNNGFSRGKALLYNVLVSLTTLVGALLAYYSLSGMNQILPYVLAVAAASFIYVALSDLIPGLHKRTQMKATVQQVVLIVSGVLVIYLAHSTLH
ncbi:MAG: ZIP family metal transporter [Gammaproteobacteria bacterium]|nr:ZIP family metal transporter [Gammaproteobacteria bacterium]